MNATISVLHVTVLPCYSPAWKSTAEVVTVHPFNEAVGPAVPVASSVKSAFHMFFTTSLLSIVIEQTNLYAKQILGENSNWSMNEEDMLAFLGFCILMGINQLPSLKDYWRKDKHFRYAPIADRIPRDNFFQILRFLHFVDNSTLLPRTDPNYDRLGKVRPIIEAVSEACKANYNRFR